MEVVGVALDDAVVIDSATHSTQWGDFLFVPVALWTPDRWGDDVPPEPLDAYTSAYLPLGWQPDGVNLLEFANSLWVRARLPVALGFAPPTCRRPIRSQFLSTALIAASENGTVLTPFVCTDQELQAELRFGPGCRDALRRAVAAGFWGLLASNSTGLANFRDKLLLPDGHGVSPTVVGYWRGLFWEFGCRW